MISPTRRLALFAAAAIPFVAVPAVLAWSVGPIARTGARWCDAAFTVLSFRAENIATASTPESALEVAAESSPDQDPSIEGRSRQPFAAGSHAPGDRPSEASNAKIRASKKTIARRVTPNVFVGPESIQRAIPPAGRPSSAWTNRTADHPAGLLIQSPGALRGVIEAGDILVEAEGQPIGNFEQLVVTVRQAYERRAKRLSGRLFRKGDFVPVTVEPGW